jgi:hypothetical protein
MKRRENLGDRKNTRVDLDRPGFVIPAPDAPWIQCKVVDISDSGVCIDVGALVVPDTFGLAFNPTGTVIRVCLKVWRRGVMIGARFLSGKELRGNARSSSNKVDPRDQANSRH